MEGKQKQSYHKGIIKFIAFFIKLYARAHCDHSDNIYILAWLWKESTKESKSKKNIYHESDIVTLASIKPTVHSSLVNIHSGMIKIVFY